MFPDEPDSAADNWQKSVDIVAQRPLVLIAKRPREWMQYEAPGQEVNVIAAEDAVFTDHLIW